MRGNKKGFMMTFLVLILFLLMFAEVVTFVTINITYNQISQNIQTASSTNNYAQALSSSADSFAQASLQRSLQTLYLYESNASLRRSNFITNFNASIASLMETSTLANVTANSVAANALNAYMGGLALSYYNTSVPRIIGASASYVTVNETQVQVFQQNPYSLSASYIENVYVNTSYGSFRYNIPVFAIISLNGTPNLMYAQQGITKYVQFGSLTNLTSIIGNQYALSGNTVAFQYGLIYDVPSAETCTGLASNILAEFEAAPFNKTVILVTSDASKLTGSGKCADNYGGLITTNIGTTNTPTNAYLVYSTNTVLSMLSTGEHELVYGPGLDVLNITGLRSAAANGYYFASPYAMSYGDIASDSVLHQSQDGIFTLSNYDTLAFTFNPGVTTNSIAASANQISTAAGGYNTVSFWMYWTGTTGEMPFGFTAYDLWVQSSTCLGFNTGNGDAYGINPTSLQKKWVYVTAVFYNGAYTGNNQIYINGVRQALSQCAGSAESGIATHKFYIGNWGDGGSYSFSGQLANVQVYNTSLSAGQIQTLFQRGVSGIPIANFGLVGWYTLNGNTNDYSGLGNNAVPSNSIYTPLSNYSRDSILINNYTHGVLSIPGYTQGLQPIPGLLQCDDYSDCMNPSFSHLYAGMSPLLTNTSQMQVADFNGQDSYIDEEPPSTLSGSLISGAAWVYLTDNDSGDGPAGDGNNWLGIISLDQGCDSPETLAVQDGVLVLDTCGSNGGNFDSALGVPEDKWTFVAYTIDDNSIKFYVNGNSASVTSSSPLTINNRDIYLGADEESGIGADPSIDGNMANVQVYNTSLSSGQVNSLYNEGINGAPIPGVEIAGWYPLNGNADDYSGNGDGNGYDFDVGYSGLINTNYIPHGSIPNSYESELQALGFVNN